MNIPDVDTRGLPFYRVYILVFPSPEQQRQVYEKLVWFRKVNREVGITVDLVFPGCGLRPEAKFSFKQLAAGEFDIINIAGSWKHKQAMSILWRIPMRTEIVDLSLPGSPLYRFVQTVKELRHANESKDARA